MYTSTLKIPDDSDAYVVLQSVICFLAMTKSTEAVAVLIIDAPSPHQLPTRRRTVKRPRRIVGVATVATAPTKNRTTHPRPLKRRKRIKGGAKNSRKRSVGH